MNITTIIPVLNGMPYLSSALASLEQQNYRGFEVILWDNGSVDGSVEEANQWIPNRLPGRVVTGKSLPLHECLSRMVEESKTEFVARMDADDLCLPDRLLLQTNFMRANPNIAGVGGQVNLIDINGDKILHQVNYPTSYMATLSRMLFQSPVAHPAMLMRREKVLAAGNYRASQPTEDFDLWFRLIQQGGVNNLPQTVLSYRLTETSVTARSKQNQRLQSSIFECLVKNIPNTFDISREEVISMLHGTHKCAFKPLMRAARSISNICNTPLREVLSCPDFLFSARCLTGKYDFLSKLVFRYWGRP